MESEEKRAMQRSVLVKMVFHLASLLDSAIDRIFRLSLFLSVMLTGIVLALPVMGVWTIFLLAHYLPYPLMPIVVWTMLITLIALAAATDYVRSIS